MQILDDKGFLFGRINIVDALVVLFIIAVLIAGLALVGVGQSNQTSEYEVTMLVNSTDNPAATSITTDHETNNIHVTQVTTDNEYVRVTLLMEVETRDNNHLYLRDNGRVVIGEELTVDLDTIVFKGLVVGLRQTTTTRA